MNEKVRIQDDLFQAVNGEWLEQAVIPEDRPFTGGFSDLDEGVEKLLMGEFDAFAKGEKPIPDVPAMNDAVAYYRLAVDGKRREEEGIKPLLPLLEKIGKIQNVKEWNAQFADLLFEGAEMPFLCGVEVDMADATKHAFILVGPRIILPDVPFYSPEHPANKPLLGVWSAMAEQALAFAPIPEEDRKKYVEDALAFDALIAKTVKTRVEWADYAKNHNPMDVEEVAKLLAPLDFKGLLNAIYGEKAPKEVDVYDPRAIKEFGTYFTEENFPLFIHWCYVRTLLRHSGELSLTLRAIGNTYGRALTGVAKDPALEKDAYRAVSGRYSEPIGLYYGRTYFGEEAKKDVVELVHKIIDTYKERVVKNTFLKESTKEKAICKLSTIAVKMGYPDDVHDLYKSFRVEEGDSFFSASQRISALNAKDNFERLNQPVDRTEWLMPGHMVNACYNPSMNDITFPAAILQKPFYSLHQLPEENLGGIGAVIGHEISHAFDNNGAQFDENGNLASWWSKEDYEAFKGLTQQMIEQWDGIPFHGGKVNGTLVVSENIADNGGMAVTLAIAKNLPNPDYQAYFKNWARVWCRKAKEEYISLLLQSDVHSPAELRANIQPRNFPEWYQAFDVKETDQMYIAPEKRIIIW